MSNLRTFIPSPNIGNYFDATGMTVAPTANSDAANTDGNGVFTVGSKWFDETANQVYMCIDATTTAAIWLVISNDYEEGTFAPVLSDATSGGNLAAIGAAVGTFTRIGDLCYVFMQLTNINTAGMTAGNDLILQGLPFTSAILSYMTGTIISHNVSYVGELVFRVSSNSTTGGFGMTLAGVADSLMNVSGVNLSSSDIYVNFVYKTQ